MCALRIISEVSLRDMRKILKEAYGCDSNIQCRFQHCKTLFLSKMLIVKLKYKKTTQTSYDAKKNGKPSKLNVKNCIPMA